jgi:Leucine-rich repeat (LRR) protein
MANNGGFYPKKQTQKTYYEVRENVTLIEGLNQFDITDLLVGKITNWTNGIVAIDKSLFRVEVINANGSVMLPEIKVINNYTYGFDSIAQTNSTVSVHYEGDLGVKDVITPSYNFDLTMDWSILKDANGQLYPVTNQATFTQWLTNGSDNFDESYNNFTDIVITDFIKVSNNIKCNLTATGTYFALSNNTITNADKIGIINGLQYLFLHKNQIVTFNPTIALPSSLQYLELNNNQIVTFNPTIALPSSLQGLNLYNNQLSNFNPTIALPSSLQNLFLNNNQLSNFNPTIALPSSLQNLFLNNNQFALAGYIATEAWANSLPVSTGKTVNFSENLASVSGTNLQAILISKGWSVLV